MPFSELSIPKFVDSTIYGDVLIITKFNWDYEACLDFQKEAQSYIQKNRHLKIYIFCNHPHIFTLGRGNERGVLGLTEFDESKTSNLSFPVHKIRRGGGITFHYPGQWIFYPIVSINTSYTLEDHMCWLLRSVKEVLIESYGLTEAISAKKLMGVWLNRKKLASIGVGLNRFVTEHGIALNVLRDKTMFDELVKINPCGMDSQTYQAMEEVCEVGEDPIREFHQHFLNKYLLRKTD